MSEAKFTPGPWPVVKTGDGKRYIVGEWLVDGPNGYEVAEVYSDDCDPDEAKANAHLIAAAPDLYEALQRLVNVSAEIAPDVQSASVFVDSRAALAKARGES